MRYFIAFLLAIGLIVLVFILIFKSFSGSGSPQKTPKPLTDYTGTNTVMQMTIDGVINADTKHYQMRMTVGQTDNQLELLTGYEGTVARQQTYPSNQAAYGEFLRALDLAGYTKGDTSKSLSDERGYCPFGERYIFEIINGDTDVERFWSTSCGGQGSYKGNTSATKNLFINQMPDYTTFIQNTGLF